MNILVFGGKGWIGGQFIDILKETKIKYHIASSRADNINDITHEINNIKPTHIISFIGRTHGTIGSKVYSTIDYLEQKGKLVENIRDNLFGPLNLALIAQQHGIHFTYLGTGCIFSYDDKHPYEKSQNGFTETSKPNFVGSSYSIVKGFTDQLMSLVKDNTLNLRIRMPITETNNPRNFITKITNYEKICSIKNSMSVLPILLPKIIDLMRLNHKGTLNFTNPGLISHNEILEMYKEIVDPRFTWKNFSISEQSKILASERSNNYLDTSKLKELFPDIPNIKEGVKWCLEKYSKVIVDKDYYNLSGKTILVTGGCGFIGSHFINHILDSYNDLTVINIDCLYYCANKNNVKHQNNPNYHFIRGNITSEDLVNYILEKYQINAVIHFAAQSHVQNSFDNSRLFTDDNVKGTHNLLECSRKYGKLERFIHVSTDEVYGESIICDNNSIKSEKSILCPTNPYAATKAAAEMLVMSYSHSYNMPVIITRGNNVYGPNQYPEKLIPKFIKLLNEDKQVTIQGDGSSVRAFLHASDTASAFKTILTKGELGEIYNIGCDEGMEYSVIEVAKILIKKIKGTDEYDKWIKYVEDRPFNDQRYYISNQKLRELGWDIKVTFLEGLVDLI